MSIDVVYLRFKNGRKKKIEMIRFDRGSYKKVHVTGKSAYFEKNILYIPLESIARKKIKLKN